TDSGGTASMQLRSRNVLGILAWRSGLVGYYREGSLGPVMDLSLRRATGGGSFVIHPTNGDTARPGSAFPIYYARLDTNHLRLVSSVMSLNPNTVQLGERFLATRDALTRPIAISVIGQSFALVEYGGPERRR